MNNGHWSQMARFWSRVGPPLRPSAEDLVYFQAHVSQWADRNGRAPRILILGVTPELHALDWPNGTKLYALDRSKPMIEAVWPGQLEEAMLGSWEAMPLKTASCDLVLCDGGFGLLSYPSGQQNLLHELHRVLVPGGVFAVRLFAPVGKTGTVDEVFRKLDEGGIPNLDTLKLYLWGALHGGRSEGVRPREVVSRIFERFDDLDQFARDRGWPVEHVRSLELHRDSAAVYYLTDADELARMATCDPGGFMLTSIDEPDHAYGHCCPILKLERD